MIDLYYFMYHINISLNIMTQRLYNYYIIVQLYITMIHYIICNLFVRLICTTVCIVVCDY